MSSITAYPTFQPIDQECQRDINEIVFKFPPYSDFNFISLFSWNIENKMGAAILNNNLVVRFDDYVTKEPFLSLIGSEKIDETIKVLLDYCEKNSMPKKLSLVPEVVVSKIGNPSNLVIKEDRNAFDYLVDAKKLTELKGKDYSGKRHGVNKFTTAYSEKLSVKYLVVDSDNTIQILDTFKRWVIASKEENGDTQNELIAVKRLLGNSDNLDLEIIGIYIEASMVAFSIYEILPNNFAMGHFEKAIKDYAGIFDYLKHITASHLYDLGVKYINYEQDLGIDGLRHTKMLLHPDYFLKKYTITSK